MSLIIAPLITYIVFLVAAISGLINESFNISPDLKPVLGKIGAVTLLFTLGCIVLYGIFVNNSCLKHRLLLPGNENNELKPFYELIPCNTPEQCSPFMFLTKFVGCTFLGLIIIVSVINYFRN